MVIYFSCFFFSSRRRHTRWPRDWSSDVCSSDLYYIDNRKHQKPMRWKGQHVRDEARLRDRLWSATVGQPLPEEPIRQPARTAPDKLAGAAGRRAQREGRRDD